MLDLSPPNILQQLNFKHFFSMGRQHGSPVFYISGTKPEGKIPLQGNGVEHYYPARSRTFLPPTRKAVFLMRTALAKLESSHLTLNESPGLRCEAAIELKDRGDYDRARDIMHPFWKTFGERPKTEGLHPEIAAELLLHVRILTRWIGSKNQVKESSHVASDLISESITYLESEKDVKKVAAAGAELAYWYWREGAFNEARIMFTEALKKLTAEGNTRANALLGLSVVEWSASWYHRFCRSR